MSIGKHIKEHAVLGIASSNYNVKSYGATGNGTTDDSVACQAALDAAKAAGGGVVYFPVGTYLIGLLSDNGQTHNAKIKGGLKIGSNTTVQGAGWGTVLKIAGASYTNTSWSKMPLLTNDDFAGGNSNIIIRDMFLDGNRDEVVGFATEMEGIDFVSVTNFLIENVYLEDVTHDSIDLDLCARGVINAIKVKNTVATNMWNGFHAGSTNSYMTVSNSYFENCGLGRVDGNEAGLHNASSNAITIGNHVVGCNRGIYHDGAVSNTVISGNLVEDTVTSMWGIQSRASYSNIVGNVVHGGAVTVQYGITLSDTTQGGTIVGNTIRANRQGIVAASTGPVIVQSNTILGNPSVQGILLDNGPHICTGNSVEGKPSSSARGAIHATADANGAQIKDNNISGASAGRGILSDADDVIITGNSITGISSGGVEIDIAATANDNIVAGNRIAAGTLGINITSGSNRTNVYGNNLNGTTTDITDAGTASQVAGATGAGANIA